MHLPKDVLNGVAVQSAKSSRLGNAPEGLLDAIFGGISSLFTAAAKLVCRTLKGLPPEGTM